MQAAVDDPVRSLRPGIEQLLGEHLDRQRAVLGAVGPELAALVNAAGELVATGKRLRPAFCYWGWRGAGEPDCTQIRLAAASLELFHAAALVHDDLIDGSDTRRGLPSVHRRFAEVHRDAGWRGDSTSFGAAAAVLLGDLCLSWSDELFHGCGLPDAALRRGRPVFERMRTELMGGQYLDVLGQVTGPISVSAEIERARRVIRFKSAKYTVEEPLLLGGSLAGANPDLLRCYAAYGLALGEAFQLRDDVLGVFGDPDRTGKPAGDDLREGKRTLLIAYAREAASPAAARVLDTLLGDRSLQSAAVDELRAIILDTGALIRVERQVDELVAVAAKALAEAQIAGEARAALGELISAATARVH